MAIPPRGSPFFRFVQRHPDVFGELPGYIHRAIVRRYIEGATARGLRTEELEALVYDERFLDENEQRLGTIDIPVRVL